MLYVNYISILKKKVMEEDKLDMEDAGCGGGLLIMSCFCVHSSVYRCYPTTRQ